MLDKSTLQSLSHDELDVLRRYFSLVIPPVLLFEILADLKKKPAGDRDPSVQSLARRIVPSASLPILPSARRLIEAEILGAEIKLGHRPVVLGGKWIRSESGKRGAELEQQPEEVALLRWQQGEFHAGEEALAEHYREFVRVINPGALQQHLHGEYSERLRLKSLEETEAFVDDLLASADPRRMIDWFFSEAIPDRRLRSMAEEKGVDAASLGGRFPFLSHCIRVSLIFHFATGHKLLSLRPTNRIDVEYFFYLPFTLGFSSGDKLHQQLFEIVRLGKNDFVHREAMKADMRRIKSHLDDHPDAAELVRPPDLAADSFTASMWKKYMKPTSMRRGELMKRLSPEDERRMLEHIQEMRSGQPDGSGDQGGDPDFLFRPTTIHRDGPCICHSGKAFGDCCGQGF